MVEQCIISFIHLHWFYVSNSSCFAAKFIKWLWCFWWLCWIADGFRIVFWDWHAIVDKWKFGKPIQNEKAWNFNLIDRTTTSKWTPSVFSIHGFAALTLDIAIWKIIKFYSFGNINNIKARYIQYFLCLLCRHGMCVQYYYWIITGIHIVAAIF